MLNIQRIPKSSGYISHNRKPIIGNSKFCHLPVHQRLSVNVHSSSLIYVFTNESSAKGSTNILLAAEIKVCRSKLKIEILTYGSFNHNTNIAVATISHCFCIRNYNEETKTKTCIYIQSISLLHYL